MDARLLPMSLLMLALAACGGESDDAEPGAAEAAANAPVAAAGDDAARPAAADVAAAPATGGALPIESDAVAYFGFKTAPFGSDEKMLRESWNGELIKQGPEQADGCYYLFPRTAELAQSQQAQPPAQGQPQQQTFARRQPIGFMFERGRFARIDVTDPALIAPGGGRIGMVAQEIASLYPQRAEARPHQYVDGAQYLRVPDAGNSGQVLLFETDSNGRVTSWRIGATPQIDYPEGCS